MKILVTGASGYIGSHLLKRLAISVIGEIITLDLIGDVDIKADMRDIYGRHEEYDAVIHLAAKVQVGESVKNPLMYYDNNVNGTINILQTFKTKNFIFASTGTVEHMNCPYAISKKACEEIIEEYCKNNNINYTIFRFYNVIGSDGIKPTNPDGLFYALIKAIETKTFNIFGNDYNTIDGTCVRDYVHVNEICNALIKAIFKPSNSIESLGHGTGKSVLEIVNTFKHVNNVDFNINFVDRRPGDIETSVLKTKSTYLTSLYTFEDLLKI